MSSIFKKIQKLELYKYRNIVDRIVKTVIIFFLIWFYGILMYNDGISTFLFLFSVFPLLIASGCYYLFSMNYFYAFALGFLIQWILFLNINPYPIENENKIKIMSFIPPEYKPEQEYLIKKMNNQEIENMKYPVIIKPIVCSGNANGIFVFNSYAEFMKFMIDNQNFDFSEYMIQNFLDGYDVEIGILYEHKPWKKRGEIIEIAEKTQKERIRPAEEKYKLNLPELINEDILNILDEISKRIPGFYVGRYDIRLKNLEDLNKRDFKIIEVNGTMGMNLMGNDNLFDLNDMSIDLRWYLSRLLIGGYNIATLNGYNPFNLIRSMLISLNHGIGCNDWENIFSLYS
jgi:hypothetical protein